MIRQWSVPFITCFLVFASFGNASAKPRAIIPDKFASPYIGAITVDAATGRVLFEDHADEPGYPASVQKVMELLVILDKVGQGALKIGDSVQVTVEASKMGGSQVYLDPREKFPVEDLLYALMVKSANDAAVLLASHAAGSTEAFIGLMNLKAKEIGMKNTVFHSVHGLPPSEGSEPDVTTARDLAVLGRELILKHPEALKYTATVKRDFRGGKLIMENHDHLLKSYAGCDGLKTGYFTQAGYSIIATASRNGARVITVVLGAAKGPNPSHPNAARDQKAAELMTKGFAALARTPAVK
jgi:serine-type D-Ala-D-Ala carboxypeptidase (penicillin-binding protein 5/6)